MGPEHEFSLVGEDLRARPIVDKVLKTLAGRIVNNICNEGVCFGKELQTHVSEVKASIPFESPTCFEGTIQNAVTSLEEFIQKRFGARLLGTGMHPFILPSETRIWKHRDRRIYDALGQIFNMNQHGWLNIQSFQLNLPYRNETDGIRLHNLMVNLVPYLPAISASSPIYESRVGRFRDNRLHFYGASQREIPSITGDVVPEYVASFEEYQRRIISVYTSELKRAGAQALLLEKEWINSRGAIFRFDRKAIEIRVMDEQECVKMDVALSCFIRAVLRGWMRTEFSHQSRDVLINNYKAIVKDGLEAIVDHPAGECAKEVCLSFLDTAKRNATAEEKKYLSLIDDRITKGNLANLILRDVAISASERNFHDSVVEVYLRLIKCLQGNTPYS